MTMHSLLDRMDEIVLGDIGLNQVISLDVNGQEVTVRDLLAQIQPVRREATLNEGAGHAHSVGRAKEVSSLEVSEVDTVVYAYLDSIPAGRALAIEGYGSFTVSQLREEVRNKTAVGEEIKSSVLQYNRFIEEAIKKGMVRTESTESAAAG